MSGKNASHLVSSNGDPFVIDTLHVLKVVETMNGQDVLSNLGPVVFRLKDLEGTIVLQRLLDFSDPVWALKVRHKPP